MVRSRAALVVLAFLLVFPTAFAPIVPKPRPLLYFPTTVGARWVYETPRGDETLFVSAVTESAAGKVVAISRESGGVVTPFGRVAVSRTGLSQIESEGVPHAAPVWVLRLPARAGDTWVSTLTTPGKEDRRMAFTVRGEEEVETDAGRFRAVRVESEEPTGRITSLRVAYWFALGIGLVKSRVAEVPSEGRWLPDRELKSFSPGRD